MLRLSYFFIVDFRYRLEVNKATQFRGGIRFPIRYCREIKEFIGSSGREHRSFAMLLYHLRRLLASTGDIRTAGGVYYFVIDLAPLLYDEKPLSWSEERDEGCEHDRG